jgi:hypothetical protein
VRAPFWSGIAASLLALATLSACHDDADSPSVGAANEGLGEGIWNIAEVGDFNGDGMLDLLWDDPGKSLMAVWLMEGTGVLLRGEPIPGPPGAAWDAVWAADFNADLMTDVRWHNKATEATAIWLMTGTELLLPGQIIPGPAGHEWTRVSSTDFDADGMADLLWRNTVTSAAEVWLMHSTTLFLRGPEIPPPPGGGFAPMKTGDFNRDGMADLFWHNATTGSYSIMLMNGTEPFLRGPTWPGPPGADWLPVIGRDFNLDRIGDMLWYNTTTHAVIVWLMTGTEVFLPGLEIAPPPGDGWVLATAGDVNADAMADLVWQNPALGRFAVWLMNGTEVILRGPELPGPAAL